MTPERHLTAFDVDALALGALTPREVSAAQAHLQACEACRQQLEIRRDADQRFTASVAPRTLEKVQERLAGGSALPREWLRWLAVPALALAVLLAVVAMPKSASPPALAIKGGGLQLFARQGDQVIPVVEGTVLHPGDQLRMAVEPDGYAKLLVVSLDGAGHASVYFPFGGTHSGDISARSMRAELPGSLTLDSSPGPERLFALFSNKELAVAEVMPALQALAAKGPAALRTETTLAVTVDRQDSVAFEKATP